MKDEIDINGDVLCPKCGTPDYAGYGHNADGTVYFYCTECDYIEGYIPKTIDNENENDNIETKERITYEQ